MFPATGSTTIAASPSPYSETRAAAASTSLYAPTMVCAVASVGTPRLGGAEQCRLSARLLARWGRGDDDWRNWNLARRRARQAVQGREADLRAVACKESHR